MKFCVDIVLFGTWRKIITAFKKCAGGHTDVVVMVQCCPEKTVLRIGRDEALSQSSIRAWVVLQTPALFHGDVVRQGGPVVFQMKLDTLWDCFCQPGCVAGAIRLTKRHGKPAVQLESWTTCGEDSVSSLTTENVRVLPEGTALLNPQKQGSIFFPCTDQLLHGLQKNQAHFEYLDLEVVRRDQKTFVSCKSNTDGWSLRYDLGETEELSQTSSPSAESTFQTRRLLSALKFMSALAPSDTCANLMDQGGLVLFAEVASERDPREATASCVCLVDNVYL